MEGVADPGEFAPIVKVRRIVKVGNRVIPEPKIITLDELLTGRFDAQWVEITGVRRRSASFFGGTACGWRGRWP